VSQFGRYTVVTGGRWDGESLHERPRFRFDRVAARSADDELLRAAEAVPAGVAPGAIWPQMFSGRGTISAAARLSAAAWRAGICAAASARRVSAATRIGASAAGTAAFVSVLIR